MSSLSLALPPLRLQRWLCQAAANGTAYAAVHTLPCSCDQDSRVHMRAVYALYTADLANSSAVAAAKAGLHRFMAHPQSTEAFCEALRHAQSARHTRSLDRPTR